MSEHGSVDLEPLDQRDGWGPLPRVIPLAVLALMLGVRIASGTPWGSAVEYAAWGYVPLALAAVLHLLALRFPTRYALDGAAWATTILAGSLTTVLVLAGGR